MLEDMAHRIRAKKAKVQAEDVGNHLTSDIATALEELRFPADRQRMLEYVRDKKTDVDKIAVLATLAALPEKTYHSPMEVMTQLPE